MNADPSCAQRPNLQLLAVLVKLCEINSRSWCYPSQEKLLELLERFHGMTRSRRQLNRDLASLEAYGYIQRTRRHTKAKDGSLWLKSTLYTLRKAAYSLIGIFGAAAQKLSTLVVNKFNHYAVPKTAQYARHEYLIMKLRREKKRRSTFW
jgi:hypothetical protein